MTAYRKTPAGQQEISTRSGALGARARRLLILVDGQRGAAELRTLSGDEHAQDTLQGLIDGGYIEATDEGAHRETDQPARSSAAFAPPGGQGKDLQVARDFMMNTLRTFNGPYAKLDLVKRIHASHRAEELRALFDEWLQSVSESRIGRKRADELSARLLEVM